MQDSYMSKALILATVSLAIFVAMAVVPTADADPQEQEYDEDLGSVWSQTIIAKYKGYEAQYVDWDFGDGTEVIRDWTVTHTYEKSHTYAEPGVYYITQTAVNELGSSTAVYKITILGYPYIEFDSMGGTPVDRIQQTSGGINATAAAEPEAPTKDGSYFAGWYTDRDCTQPYDWTQPVTEGITLYAGWSETPVEEDPDEKPGDSGEEGTDDGSETDWLAIGLIILGAVIVLISIIAISAVGAFAAIGVLFGIIIAIAGALKFMGVF